MTENFVIKWYFYVLSVNKEMRNGFEVKMGCKGVLGVSERSLKSCSNTRVFEHTHARARARTHS